MIYRMKHVRTGEVREVFAKGNEATPICVRIDADGSWYPTAEDDPEAWGRCWEVPNVAVSKGYAVSYRKTLPMAVGLPLDQRAGEPATMYGHQVRRHKDGTHSTLDGVRIIETRRDRERHLAHTGFTESK